MADINSIVLPDGTEYPISDYYLPVSISNPTNGQVLKYDATNNVWYNGEDASGSSVLYGTSAPTSQLGTDGCLYVKYTEGTGGASDTVDALYVKLDGDWCQISTGGGGGASSADQVSVDDTDLEYEADDVQEALEKIYKTITLAEYEQLTTAEKDNGTIYFITDVTGANQRLTKQISNQAIASFDTDIADRLVNLQVAVTATGGGGTPSTPIAINGFTGANIVNMSDITNKAFFDGLLNGTFQFVNLGDLPWIYTSGVFYSDGLTDKVVLSSGSENFLNVDYTIVSNSTSISNMPDMSIKGQNGDVRIYIKNSNYTNATLFKNAMNNHYLIYELATPITPTITKAQFETLLSAFSINGSINTINFGQTVYGGSLDVISGKLTITHGYINLGDLTYTKTTNYGYTFFEGSSVSNKGNNALCSCYTTVNVSRAELNDNEVGLYNVYGANQPCIRDDSKASLTPEQFKSAVNGQLLTFELSTPTTIQLTSEEVTSIVGNNNIYSDTGDIIDLKYQVTVGQAIS